MVVKKKKMTAKKAAKKNVKKAAKKVVKKTTAKVASKKIKAKKVAKTKKVVKQSKSTAKPIKKVAQKAVKKPAQKPMAKIVSTKMTSVKVTPIKKAAIVRPSHKTQSNVARPIMREQSSRFDDMPVVETTERKKPTTLLGALEFTPYQAKSDEAYMSELQRDHFRKILDAWKQQLMQDVDLTVGHLKEEAVFYADPVDRAAQEEGFNLELRTRDRERKLIKKIEQSLDLINAGEYGFCEDCGAEIGIRRLEARPTAVKCIDCKTFQEIREKQMGG